MSKNIIVGTGLFKKSFFEALELAKPGDCLLLDPGEYNLNQTVELTNIRIRGNGNQPTDVKLYGTLQVEGDIELENLTVINGETIGNFKSNLCFAVYNGDSRITNCIFDGQTGKKVTTYFGGGSVYCENCTFTSVENYSVTVGGADTRFKGCQINGFRGTDQAQISVVKSRIDRYLMLEEETKLTGPNLYLGQDLMSQTITINSGAQLVVDSLIIPEGRLNIAVDHSLMQATKTNSDLMHRIFYKMDEQSTVDVPGAEL